MPFLSQLTIVLCPLLELRALRAQWQSLLVPYCGRSNTSLSIHYLSPFLSTINRFKIFGSNHELFILLRAL